ncbi:BTAD domain-containing putative transcriptional regulator [Nonomuraea sp. NPDC049504]|uniref:ATP-binding protein n=1 Tax=Nonomuraea sp. NPDC049504 TaxID=3154729 RepID=UPI00343BD011
MRFQILGPTTAWQADGEPVELGGPRVRALLTLLALDAGRIVTAGHLVDGMYGARPPEGVANALQSQVSRLRRALGRDRVEFHPAGYRLVADPEDVDARRFELLIRDGRQALAGGDPERAAALLRAGLDLWHGAPLADAPHAEAAAAALEELRLAATEDRVQADLALGRHRELVAELTRLTAAHPLRERLRAQLMRALYGSGRQAEALTVYEEARKLLDEELGIDPGPDLTAAHLAVLRADPSLTPRAPSSPPTPAVSPTHPRTDPAGPMRVGLRSQLTSFVGRAEELDRVGASLRDGRLVSLIGAGGAGKTRLAMEAAAREPGEVYFVPLAPVSGGVPQAVLAALDIRDALLHGHERSRVDPVDRLVAALADRELLLILDNCEHLVTETAELTDHLLAACPRLRVLATSREALGITGESVLPVTPLRLPPPEADDPLGYPAVRLFTDRAAAVRPGFAVDEDNRAHVVRICHALDGLPLAIELAAARLRTLPVAEVAARLDDRFRLLTRGSRTALPRHQTLRAVVAWSWDLLTEDERLMARRLSVFAGGARPEAAERVCGLPEDVLFSLTEKSLVEYVDGRFRMLATIRAFCLERLEESGEAEEIRHAHARHYLDFMLATDPLLRTSEQLVWLARVDEESDDLDAAVRWATEAGHLELGFRLLAHSACYWWMRGHRSASSHLADGLLSALGERRLPGMDEEFAMCVLVSAWNGRSDEELRSQLSEVQALLPIEWLPKRVEFLMMLLSMFTGPPSDFAMTYDLLGRYGDRLPPWQQSLAYTGRAFLLQVLGRTDEAVAEFERSLAAFRRIGERWGIVLVLSGLGNLRQSQADHRGALALADEALEVARELRAYTEIGEALCRRGDALAYLDDLEGARADYREAAELARMKGSMEIRAWALLGLGEAATADGDFGTARDLLVRAREACPRSWYSTGDTWERIETALTRLDTAGEPAGGGEAGDGETGDGETGDGEAGDGKTSR